MTMQVQELRETPERLAGKVESMIKVSYVWSLQRKPCAVAKTSQVNPNKTQNKIIIFYPIVTEGW